MYRKFSLTNGNSATWDFTEKTNSYFAANPSGLGLSISNSLLRLGNKQKLIEQTYEFIDKSFEVLFYGDTLDEIYYDYNKFVEFLSVGDISLIYDIPSQSTSYRISVVVDMLDKTEVKDNGIMSCGFTLTPLSFWEDNIKNVLNISSSASGDDGKAYPLTRPYKYAISSLNNIEIDILGTIESPLEITIEGTTTNPQYSLFNENGDVIGIGEFEGTFDKVYVNSDEVNEEIILSANNVELENPYNYQKIDIGDYETMKITFLNLQKNYNRLSFNLGSTFDGTVILEWRNRYISV